MACVLAADLPGHSPYSPCDQDGAPAPASPEPGEGGPATWANKNEGFANSFYFLATLQNNCLRF